MLHYLLEDGVTTEEWKLRQKVLDLHNTIVRLRLFKGLGNSAGETYKTFKKSAELLRAELATLPAFKSLEEQRRSKIMSGNELYIRGMRSVLKQLKIDVEYFDAIYNYLSA